MGAPHPSVYGKNKLHSVVFKERQKVEWVGHGIDMGETEMVQIWEELGWYRSERSWDSIDTGGAGNGSKYGKNALQSSQRTKKKLRGKILLDPSQVKASSYPPHYIAGCVCFAPLVPNTPYFTVHRLRALNTSRF